MAPHKCSFIIFSNDKTISGDNNINIKLFKIQINKSVDPVFLGIRFDKHLKFQKSNFIFKRFMLVTS